MKDTQLNNEISLCLMFSGNYMLKALPFDGYKIQRIMEAMLVKLNPRTYRVSSHKCLML